ncbi:MAG: regulatory protein RecX [Pseudomonadota bacterium]
MRSQEKPLRDTALDALARREHSHFELTKKLLAKGYDANEVEAELSSLVREGVLDDLRFAEAYAHHRARRGYGRFRLVAELKERGVSAEVIGSALDTADFDWASIIEDTWRKKFGSLPANFQESAKQARFLEYRGFPSDSIKQLFRRLQDQAKAEELL